MGVGADLRTMNSEAATASRPHSSPGTQPLRAPILKVSRQRIDEMSKRPSTSLSHMQQAIEADPALALNLFAEVNAMLKRTGHPPATDFPRAVLFMGIAEVIERFRHAAILDESIERSRRDGLVQILCRAHHAAHQARAIGTLARGINVDEILAAALTAGVLDYLAALSSQRGFAPDLALAQELLPAPPGSPDAGKIGRLCLDLGSRFAAATEIGWDEEMLEPIYAEVAQFTGRGTDEIARRLKVATVEAARAGDHFGFYRAANHLMSPGRRPTVVPPNSPPQTALPAKRRTPTQKPCRSTAASDDLERVVERLVGAARGGRQAASILPYALQAICDHIGFRLAVFLMLDNASGTLTVRLHRGLKLPPQFGRSRIHTDKNPVLAHLLAPQSVIHWRPEKHKAGLDRLPLQFLGGQEGLLCSIHLAGKPLGVIMACRPRDTLSPRHLGAFKKLSAGTAKALAETRGPAATLKD